MKYTIQITPDDKIKVMEYTDYHTINDLVDGWYERCGVFGVLDKMCMIFCNEEFLYQDNCKFNAVGSALAAQPIYGNVVVMLDGYNEEDEHDAIPMTYQEAKVISQMLMNMQVEIAPLLSELTAKYSGKKIQPKMQIVSMTEEDFSQMMGNEE